MSSSSGFLPADFSEKSIYYVSDKKYQLAVFNSNGIVHASEYVAEGAPIVNSDAATWAIVKGELWITYSGNTQKYKLISNDAINRYYQVEKTSANGSVKTVVWFYDQKTALAQAQAFINNNEISEVGSNSSPSTYPFSVIWINSLRPSSKNFNISGYVNGMEVTGSGTVTRGAFSTGIFEGVSANRQIKTLTGEFAVGGTTVPMSSYVFDWVNSNYEPLGKSGGDDYFVVRGVPTFPATVRVNDSGALYSAEIYNNSSKSGYIGTVSVTYVVEADTATTALLRIITEERNAFGMIKSTLQSEVKIWPSGEFELIKEIFRGDDSVLIFNY